MGRAIEPRKSSNEKADAFPLAEGNTDSPVNLDEGRSASPESKSSARMHTPLHGNRETSDAPRHRMWSVAGSRGKAIAVTRGQKRPRSQTRS